MVRRAIGASVAASLLFSSLILSNLVLISAGERRVQLTITSDSESLLGDSAIVSEGTEALNVLGGVQDYLSNRTIQCQTAASDLATFIVSLRAAETKAGLTVRIWPSMGAGPDQTDNFTLLKPFNGWVAGGIDISVKVSSSGVSPLGDVAYNRTEIHHINLPVLFAPSIAFCHEAVREISARLGSATIASCNESSIGPTVSAVEATLRARARLIGLDFALGYRVVPLPSCLVDFDVQLAQLGATGPEGPFNVRLDQVGTVHVPVE